MNWPLILVVAMLIATMTLFALNKPSMDAVAVLILVVFPVTGILTTEETLAGFADANVILIAALFVVSEGLSRTGLTYRLGDWLSDKAGVSSTRLLVLLMVIVAGLGSVMSSTGVVAIFIPVVLSICRRMRISPRQLMMPLSFAALSSGMLTLIATPPNLVVDAELVRSDFAEFGFFAPTPFGLVVLVLAVVYMLAMQGMLAGEHDGDNGYRGRTYRDLIADYQIAGRERRLRVEPGSPLIEQRLADLDLRREHGMNVVAIEHRQLFRRHLEVSAATGQSRIARGDVLMVDVFDVREGLDETIHVLGLTELPLQASFLTERSREVGMAEVIFPASSAALGKKVAELRLRHHHRVEPIGLRRGDTASEGRIAEKRLRLGDTLLVMGRWKDVQSLNARTSDFVVLDLPAEVNETAPAASRAPLALASLAVMVTLMITGAVPNVVAALIGCLLMGLFGCIDMPSAYRAIHWPTVLVIVGMLPFALALQQTGGIELLVSALTSAIGEGNPTVLIAGLFVTTAVIGLFISNTATAVLMAPVAISMAEYLGASPYPFAMVVALAASSAFMTPVSSPVNMLVLGPGRYRFSDFVKLGVPFTVICLVVAVVMVPWLLPLYPDP